MMQRNDANGVRQPQTFAQKALARAAGLDFVEIGQIVDARPDVVLSHDNTAAIRRIWQEFGQARVLRPERLAITLDHAVPAPTTKHAQNHAEIRRFVAEQGIAHFFEVGRGICHQVLSEEAIVLPGQLILGADSHTTHYGWLGAFGAGIGRSEVAALWATGELWLRVPESMAITLEGALPPGVTAKDFCLRVIGDLGADGGLYQSIEFGGSGIAALSLESRMVLPNMMAEFGAKNAYLAPDDLVIDYLAERLGARQAAARGRAGYAGRGEPHEGVRATREEQAAARGVRVTQGGEPHEGVRVTREEQAAARGVRVTQQEGTAREVVAAGCLYPDEGAVYTAHYHYRAADLETYIACPHTMDNVAPLSQVAGTPIQQAFLGTCTNGRLEDLAAAAAVLRGRQVAPGVRMIVIPASSQVLKEALAAGYIQTFVEAGAVIGVPGCGPCMGNHMGIPAPGEVTISSANRNFRGRMGTPDSEIYLSNPAVVAASAIKGVIAGPQEVTE